METVQDFTVSLTDEQVEAFRRDGFLSIERITTDAEIEWLKSVYDDLFGTRAGEEAGNYFDLGGRRGGDKPVLPQILEPEKKRPELADTIYARNARELAARLIGVSADSVTPFGHMILKPAGFGRETPWHQDEAYWPTGVIANSVSAWMPLDPATVDSGCMQFIPGSHRGEVRWHHHLDNDPLTHALVTDDVDDSLAVPCPIPAGGATFHHCRVLHYAGPNRSEQPRRAYIQTINGPTTPDPNPARRPWNEEEAEALERYNAERETQG